MMYLRILPKVAFTSRKLLDACTLSLFVKAEEKGTLLLAESNAAGPDTKWIPLPINFSAQTQSFQVQDAIESRTVKRGKKHSPIGGKKMMTFVDDLNMPSHDKFHSQPPLELLRQWMDYSGWYNKKDKETPFTQIMNMQLLAGMGPPGGGRNPIS
jgi:dynein heavy chain